MSIVWKSSFQKPCWLVLDSCSVCFFRDKCQSCPDGSGAGWGGVWWRGFRMWKLSGSRWHYGFLRGSHCWTAHPNWLCMWRAILYIPHLYICIVLHRWLKADDWFSWFQALFVKVVPYQCLGCVWSQRDKKENMSPTIRATIAQFNTITNQVIVSLLCWQTDATSSPTSSRQPPTTPAQRARIIEKWIRVAQVSQKKSLKIRLHSSCDSRVLMEVSVKKWTHVPSVYIGRDSIRASLTNPIWGVKSTNMVPSWLYLMWSEVNLLNASCFFLQDCRQLKNFSSLRAILSALQSNAVYRLRKTWAAVSR